MGNVESGRGVHKQSHVLKERGLVRGTGVSVIKTKSGLKKEYVKESWEKSQQKKEKSKKDRLLPKMSTEPRTAERKRTYEAGRRRSAFT